MNTKGRAEDRTEANEAQIAVHWKEEGYYQPSKEFIAQANMADKGVRERFGEKNFPECFREYADMLTWFKPYKKVLDTSHPPFWKWFTGG
ncbi:MAG: acetyl-coenzyme A synthetase, partial [Burkholderiaceae bacterium]